MLKIFSVDFSGEVFRGKAVVCAFNKEQAEAMVRLCLLENDEDADPDILLNVIEIELDTSKVISFHSGSY